MALERLPVRVLYIPPRSHTERVFRPETFQRLCQRFHVTLNETGRNWKTEEVAERLPGHEVLITGWGSPPLSAECFERNPELGLIAHSAGSVKFLFPGDLWQRYVVQRGILVFSARHAIALNVAESTVGYFIAFSRHWLEQVLHVRSGGWRHPGLQRNGRFLRGSTVGLVGVGAVAREVIRLLEPFEVRLLAYDPYLSEWEAGRLGVEKVGLEELFERSDFVSLHAPITPETEKMIGRGQLRRLRDGALLLNTARGWLIDHDALYEEARTGRFTVVLDVTSPEPLPPDHPLRQLPNVYITPHVAGEGRYGYERIGEMVVQAVEHFALGRPVEGAIRYEEYPFLA